MRTFFNKTMLFSILLSLHLPFDTSYAAPKRIEISEGQIKPEPIAVHHFQGDLDLGIKISQIIRKDLAFSGYFYPTNPLEFEHLVHSEQPHCAEWRQLHVRYVVTGSVQNSGDGNIQLTYKLYDVNTGLKMREATLKIRSHNFRRLAHMVADAIFERVTGNSGFFDTKIAYIAITKGKQKVNGKIKNVDIHKLSLMDYDGHNIESLTHGETMVLTPRFSPQEDRIAFLSFSKRNARVYLFNIATKGINLLGNFSGMTFAPYFAPDNQTIIMSLAKNGKTSIYTLNTKFGKTLRLTHGDWIDTSPNYSADGKDIVFTSDRDGGLEQIYMMDANGQNVRRVSFGEGKYSQPRISPRGDKIAFIKQRLGQFYCGVMNIDGTDERLIHQTYHVIESPSWAPNGCYIMFAEEPRGDKSKAYIMIMDQTGRKKARLALPHGATDPTWSGLLSSTKMSVKPTASVTSKLIK